VTPPSSQFSRTGKDNLLLQIKLYFRISAADDYCLQFYAVLYGDEFGQMETFIQYFDENDERVEMLSIGMINQESVPRPPVDDWLPFQVLA